MPINNNMKTCKVEGCDKECDKGRRYCHEHYLQSRAEQRKLKKAAGLKIRTKWIKNCEVCGEKFEAINKHKSKYCPICWNNLKYKTLDSNNNYERVKDKCVHRLLIENLLSRKLHYNEVIHHLDGNCKNNDLSNLLILSRSKHGALHQYLNLEGAILQNQLGNEYYEKWKTLIKPLSLNWLNSSNTEYIIADNIKGCWCNGSTNGSNPFS